MANRLRMNNILIVDDDPSFIMWLGGALVSANQQPWPACSVADATVLVGEPASPVDLLIINSSLPGASELIDLLRRAHAKLKVIALAEDGKTKLAHIHAWCRKPSRPDESAKQDWLEVVKQLLIRHVPASAPHAHGGLYAPPSRETRVGNLSR